MAETLASKITADVKVPTIRIGASASCDRQILMKEDMMGFAPRPAKFVKVYADIPVAMDQAIASYAEEVRNRAFPSEKQTYTMKKNQDQATGGGGPIERPE
jgi:3-methyl-2-oxobutanoate hydroxymethyltransferase